MKEVNMGWAIRGIHINVANFMFVCLYIHIGRGIYYGSFRLYKVWATGIVMLLLVMLTAFTGYVLPWGQMSYWAAQVITTMVTAIPVVGKDIAVWVWGGYAVGNVTLKRVFSIHFILPFIILCLFMLHMSFLHETGSGNPLGVDTDCCLVRFHSFYTVKDLVGVLGSCVLVSYFVFFHPYAFVDGQSFVECDYMETPSSIHPEWYFLFAYAILRSVPNKAGGIVLMLGSILVLFIIPELWVGKFESLAMYFFCQWLFWVWVTNFFILSIIGSKPVEEPYIISGVYCTVFYFIFFPLVGVIQLYEDFLMTLPPCGPAETEFEKAFERFYDSLFQEWEGFEEDENELCRYEADLMDKDEVDAMLAQDPVCWGQINKK
uniref:cytochrome b n=1 Tax=Mimachlamys varia TaxID=50417 RepID=UPI001FA6E0A9|nr:cytochrome b [Mimachlamys varia]UNA71548.1 cytochrome b [Mimachlamys varia]